jgi:hypothetical protein
MDEISGTGYPKRDITWTTITVDGSGFDFERMEAERWLEVLRKITRAFEGDDGEKP